MMLQCCTAFYFDRDSGVLYHFSAISAAGSYKDIMGILQWSTDCGETFTKPKIVWPGMLSIQAASELCGTNCVINVRTHGGGAVDIRSRDRTSNCSDDHQVQKR